MLFCRYNPSFYRSMGLNEGDSGHVVMDGRSQYRGKQPHYRFEYLFIKRTVFPCYGRHSFGVVHVADKNFAHLPVEVLGVYEHVALEIMFETAEIKVG